MIYGQRIIRLIKIISLLRHKSYRKREFADMFKVNIKTIHRDFRVIKNCGFNIIKDLHALYYIDGNIPEISKLKEKDQNIKKISKNIFYGEYSHKTAIVKQSRDKKFFYTLKNSKNKIEYVSPKFTRYYKAISDLKFAL